MKQQDRIRSRDVVFEAAPGERRSLGSREASLKTHPDQAYDFSRYEALDHDKLARFILEALGLGVAHEALVLDVADERHRRCLTAAESALDHLWDEGAAATPGEPIDAEEDMIQAVYEFVDGFCFHKINSYYLADGEGISTPEWRRQCRRSEAAARRAVASLFGLEASEVAQRKAE